MSEPGTPNYASLSPANPAIINGMAAVDLPSMGKYIFILLNVYPLIVQ